MTNHIVTAGATERGVSLDDGLVLVGGQSAVVSDAQYARLATLISRGTLIDGGTTSASLTHGTDRAETADERADTTATIQPATDMLPLMALEHRTQQLLRRSCDTIRSRIADAGAPFTEAWANVTSWSVAATTTVGSGRLITSGSAAAAMHAVTGPRFVARVHLHTTGTSGKYTYFGISSEAPTTTADATKIMAVGIGTGSQAVAINRGAGITGAASVTPRTLPTLAAGDYLLTWAVDETHCSFSIQPVGGGQAIYWVRIAKSQMPGGVINSITLATSETNAANQTFGPVVIHNELAVPPLASRTVGGVALFGAGKPLTFSRVDTTTGVAHLVSVPGDLDSRVPAPVVLFLHQALSGSSIAPWTESRMTNVMSALETAGYIFVASDNGLTGALDQFGNQTGLDDYAGLLSWTRSHLATGSVMLLGPSQGSFFAQTMLAQRKVGGIAAVALISGGSDLIAMELDPTYQAGLRTAYGASSSADFAGKVTGFNPAGLPGWALRGVPQRWYVGAADTTAPQAAQVTPQVTKVLPYVPEASVLVTAAVGHLDASLYQGSNLVAFFDTYR